MTLFEVVRATHVVSSILWVGGGIALALGAEFARRRHGPAAMGSVVDVAALMGPGYFVPVSFLTLMTGGLAAWMGPGFSQLWVALGLAGAIATFLIGLLMIKPRTEDIARLAAEGPAASQILLRRTEDLMTVVRFDHLILLLVVVAMTLKPSASDTALLFGMGGALVLGAGLTIAKILRRDRFASAERLPQSPAAPL